jgi:hypothetical protein
VHGRVLEWKEAAAAAAQADIGEQAIVEMGHGGGATRIGERRSQEAQWPWSACGRPTSVVRDVRRHGAMMASTVI